MQKKTAVKSSITRQEYAFWAKRGYLTPEQAALLTVGVLPSAADDASPLVIENADQKARHQKALSLLIEATNGEKITPSDFLFWVKRKGFDIDKNLEKEITSAQKRDEETDKYIFNAKEQHSMLLMLRALIQVAYNREIIPYEKDSLTKTIKSDLNQLGVDRDEDTILKFIRLSDNAFKKHLIEKPTKD